MLSKLSGFSFVMRFTQSRVTPVHYNWKRLFIVKSQIDEVKRARLLFHSFAKLQGPKVERQGYQKVSHLGSVTPVGY